MECPREERGVGREVGGMLEAVRLYTCKNSQNHIQSEGQYAYDAAK